MSVDLRMADVTCRKCGKQYTCTPDQDYYNATTATNGLCWDCLLEEGDMKPQAEPDPMKDEAIGVRLKGGPKPLDGWSNAYPADKLGGWPPPEELAAFNVGGVVAVAIPGDVPDSFKEHITLYRKVKQSDLPEPGPNIFRGALYEAVSD